MLHAGFCVDQALLSGDLGVVWHVKDGLVHISCHVPSGERQGPN